MTEQMNSEKTPGKVYVASMIMRGKRAELPKELDNAVKVNVTSAQRTNNPYRVDFSPMTAIPGKYKGYHCFENYCSRGKYFKTRSVKNSYNGGKNKKKGNVGIRGQKGTEYCTRYLTAKNMIMLIRVSMYMFQSIMR